MSKELNATKFVECTLGVKYRDVGHDGTIYGGPMYYLKKGLSEKGFAKLAHKHVLTRHVNSRLVLGCLLLGYLKIHWMMIKKTISK